MYDWVIIMKVIDSVCMTGWLRWRTVTLYVWLGDYDEGHWLCMYDWVIKMKDSDPICMTGWLWWRSLTVCMSGGYNEGHWLYVCLGNYDEGHWLYVCLGDYDEIHWLYVCPLIMELTHWSLNKTTNIWQKHFQMPLSPHAQGLPDEEDTAAAPAEGSVPPPANALEGRRNSRDSTPSSTRPSTALGGLSRSTSLASLGGRRERSEWSYSYCNEVIMMLTSIGIPTIKIKQSENCLIFIKEITIPWIMIFILTQGCGEKWSEAILLQINQSLCPIVKCLFVNVCCSS